MIEHNYRDCNGHGTFYMCDICKLCKVKFDRTYTDELIPEVEFSYLTLHSEQEGEGECFNFDSEPTCAEMQIKRLLE